MPGDEEGETWWAQERTEDGTHRRYSGHDLFDELVVHGLLHLEWLDGNVWWLGAGDVHMLIEREADGRVRVDIERGSYGPVHGRTTGNEPG